MKKLALTLIAASVASLAAANVWAQDASPAAIQQTGPGESTVLNPLLNQRVVIIVNPRQRASTAKAAPASGRSSTVSTTPQPSTAATPKPRTRRAASSLSLQVQIYNNFPSGTPVANRQVAGQTGTTSKTCTPPQVSDNNGGCKDPSASVSSGSGVVSTPKTCTPPQVSDNNGGCKDPGASAPAPKTCTPPQVSDNNGGCTDPVASTPAPKTCTPPQVSDNNGGCKDPAVSESDESGTIEPKTCTPPQVSDNNGGCKDPVTTAQQKVCDQTKEVPDGKLGCMPKPSDIADDDSGDTCNLPNVISPATGKCGPAAPGTASGPGSGSGGGAGPGTSPGNADATLADGGRTTPQTCPGGNCPPATGPALQPGTQVAGCPPNTICMPKVACPAGWECKPASQATAQATLCQTTGRCPQYPAGSNCQTGGCGANSGLQYCNRCRQGQGAQTALPSPYRSGGADTGLTPQTQGSGTCYRCPPRRGSYAPVQYQTQDSSDQSGGQTGQAGGCQYGRCGGRGAYGQGLQAGSGQTDQSGQATQCNRCPQLGANYAAAPAQQSQSDYGQGGGCSMNGNCNRYQRYAPRPASYSSEDYDSSGNSDSRSNRTGAGKVITHTACETGHILNKIFWNRSAKNDCDIDLKQTARNEDFPDPNGTAQAVKKMDKDQLARRLGDETILNGVPMDTKTMTTKELREAYLQSLAPQSGSAD